jgi:hypothetical protein
MLWWAVWLFDPRDLPGLAIFAVLAGAQLLDLLATLGFWHAVWPRARPAGPLPPVPGRASILVVAHGQPVEMVEQTLRATAAIRRRHQVFLADPFVRPELRWLPSWYDVTRLTPEMGELAEVAGARFLAVFEAGQVPQPDFLEALLPYFADRGVALVQARYSLSGRRRSRLRDAVFQGGDALGEAPCLGSNYILRRRALHSIGGFGPAELSLAGSLRLGAALRADGWRTRYVSTKLADGAAVTGPAARLADYCFWAAAELASTLHPGMRPRRASMAARFYAAWMGTRHLALLGLAVSVVTLAAVARFGPHSAGWQVNLALHLFPYLLLRAAVRLVVEAGETSHELSEVPPAAVPKAEPEPEPEPVRAPAPAVRPAPEPTLEPAAMASTDVRPAVEPEFEPAVRAAEAPVPTAPVPLHEGPEVPGVRAPEPTLEPVAMAEANAPHASEPVLEPAAGALEPVALAEVEVQVLGAVEPKHEPELEPVAIGEADVSREWEPETPEWQEVAPHPEVPAELEPALEEEAEAPFAPPDDEPERPLQLPWEARSRPPSEPGSSALPNRARRRAATSPSAALAAPSRPSTAPRSVARLDVPATEERHAEPGNVPAASPEGAREPELVWNVLSLLAQEAPVQWTPAAMLLPARRRDRRPASIRRGVAVAAAAWIAMAGAIGAAAYAVIRSNPPQHAASVGKISAPPYSYYAPAPQPSAVQPGH